MYLIFLNLAGLKAVDYVVAICKALYENDPDAALLSNAESKGVICIYIYISWNFIAYFPCICCRDCRDGGK
jgi:hypothetical protein